MIILRSREGGRGGGDYPEKQRRRKGVIILRSREGGRGGGDYPEKQRRRKGRG